MLYRRKTLLSIKPAEDKNVPLMRKRVAQGGTEGKRERREKFINPNSLRVQVGVTRIVRVLAFMLSDVCVQRH